MAAQQQQKPIRRTVPLYARVPVELRADLDLIAVAQGTTRNELVQIALTEMVAAALGDRRTDA